MHALNSGLAYATNFDDARQQFLSYYPQRKRTIFKHSYDSNWFELNKTVPIQDELILEAVACTTEAFRGLRWGDSTRFAVIDIDTQSQYHNALELQKLETHLAQGGMRHVCHYQSSISGGWHLYISLNEWVAALELTTTLKSYLRALGYEIKGGQLEIFPSGNGLRLPLQKGFGWLDERGQLVLKREELATEQAIAQFVHDIESNTNDWQYTKSYIASRLAEKERKLGAKQRQERVSTDGMDDIYTCRLIQENYDLGRHYWVNGLASYGERHQAIVCIEHMLWHGCKELSIPAYPGAFNDEERFRILRDWISKNHNGHCRHILAGRWDVVEAQIRRACTWRADKDAEHIPYTLASDEALDRIARLSRKTGRTWSMEDWAKGNRRRQAGAINRIERAIKELDANGELITISSVAERAGASRNTVKKYKYLLAAWSSDQNLGVGHDLDRSGSLDHIDQDLEGSISPGGGPVVEQKEGEKKETSEIASEKDSSKNGARNVIAFSPVLDQKKKSKKSGCGGRHQGYGDGVRGPP